MSNKKGRNIKDKVQTVVFLCFLIIFPIFALAFCFYSQTNHALSEILDKSFSVSIGVFGGAATLTAAYIASLLFNDWREAYNHDFKVKILLNLLTELDDLEEIAEELLRVLYFKSVVEMSQLDFDVSPQPPQYLFDEVDKVHKKFSDNQYNNWTIGNRYLLLNSHDYTEYLKESIAYINESFDYINLMKNLDRIVPTYLDPYVQDQINYAISEVNLSIEAINNIRQLALEDIYP